MNSNVGYRQVFNNPFEYYLHVKVFSIAGSFSSPNWTSPAFTNTPYLHMQANNTNRIPKFEAAALSTGEPIKAPSNNPQDRTFPSLGYLLLVLEGEICFEWPESRTGTPALKWDLNDITVWIISPGHERGPSYYGCVQWVALGLLKGWCYWMARVGGILDGCGRICNCGVSMRNAIDGFFCGVVF